MNEFFRGGIDENPDNEKSAKGDGADDADHDLWTVLLGLEFRTLVQKEVYGGFELSGFFGHTEGVLHRNGGVFVSLNHQERLMSSKSQGRLTPSSVFHHFSPASTFASLINLLKAWSSSSPRRSTCLITPL